MLSIRITESHFEFYNLGDKRYNNIGIKVFSYMSLTQVLFPTPSSSLNFSLTGVTSEPGVRSAHHRA